MSADDVDVVVAHQANIRILSAVANRVKIPLDKFVLNIERFGNTSSASIPLALDEAVRGGIIKDNEYLILKRTEKAEQPPLLVTQYEYVAFLLGIELGFLPELFHYTRSSPYFDFFLI